MEPESTRLTPPQGFALERWGFLLLLVLVSWWFFAVLAPFFTAIFWACVLGLLFQPLYQRLLQRYPGRRNSMALITLGVCILTGIVPTLVVLASFIDQGAGLYRKLQSGEIQLAGIFGTIVDRFPQLEALLERFDLDFDNMGQQLSGVAVSAGQIAAQNVLSLGQGTLTAIINLALLLYLTFFTLRDGHRLVDWLILALPLGDARERLLLAKFAETARATVKGNLIIGVVQGTLGGLIFWALGLPNAWLWGVVMAVLSLIPLLGAGIIWAPAAIYLVTVGSWGKGIVLALFGVLVIGLVDNFLRPILVGRDTKLPDYVVLLSTLGGLALFGINGFVMGPLLAALFVATWQIFIQEFNLPSGASELPPDGLVDEEELAPRQRRRRRRRSRPQ